ncbi:MAG: hypothetical protein H0X31_00565 [Nostocaceae cyanobacterium]|nr:hypothetical protein [Nostocaceae cyanobacterium]
MVTQNSKLDVPRLETRETQGLRDKYPNIAHLEAGNVAAWLAERKQQLLEIAKSDRAEMNLSKAIGLAGTAIGAICYATSPLAPIGALIAGIGYVWAVAKDMNATHQFAPVPFARGNFLEFITAMGGKEERVEYFQEQDDLLDLLNHLDPFEKIEYAMIRSHALLLTEYLAQVSEGKRFYAYHWMAEMYYQTRGSFPSREQLDGHLVNVTADHRINYDHVTAIQQAAQSQPRNLIVELPKPNIVELPAPRFIELPSTTSDYIVAPTEAVQYVTDTTTPTCNIPDISTFLKLPVKDRAEALIFTLTQSGFKISDILTSQVIAIAGTQRGGKGTLAGLLSILAKGLDHEVEIEYFTAGVDVYPFACNLHSALDYPQELHGDIADTALALKLFAYLKTLEKSAPYSHRNLVLIIDEAMRLLSLLNEDDKVWSIQYLLSRFAKTGGTLIIVLHATNLSSVVGKNTAGLADTFKEGVSFIGCKAQFVSAGGLRKINVASGEYFQANPNNFGSAIESGNLGKIPDFLLTETHPGNGYPDPVRSLIRYFPELKIERNISKEGERINDPIKSLEKAFEAKSVPETVPEKENDNESKNQLSSRAQLVLDYFNAAKIKEPKTVRDMKKADRLSGLDDVLLIIALTELVNASMLLFDGESAWSKSEW